MHDNTLLRCFIVLPHPVIQFILVRPSLRLRSSPHLACRRKRLDTHQKKSIISSTADVAENDAT